MSDFISNVIFLIGRAIREGRYLSVSYENAEGRNTEFWIRILDLNENQTINVDIYNLTKENPILNTKIKISKIRSVELLKFSYCQVSEELIKKINKYNQLDIYNFDKYNNKILEYYLECYRASADPFLHKSHLIHGIDLNELKKNLLFQLSDSQFSKVIKDIYQDDYNKNWRFDLAICEMSIDLEAKGKFVIVYRRLYFDPIEKTILLGKEIIFNKFFYVDRLKYSMSNYLEISQSDFEKEYKNDSLSAAQFLSEKLRDGEILNTRPEVVVLGFSQIDLTHHYENIDHDFGRNEAELPLKAFFGNISLLDRTNRKRPNIVLYDNNVNIHQLRSIYNALKYPITYVQGPPGTGKTQTILNIAVNCLATNRTLLISSNNNVPLDGIYSKLDLGKYNGKEIILPILRLGNEEYTSKALERIRFLYEFETKDIPKDNLLSKLITKSNSKNKKLNESLEAIDNREVFTQNLKFINDLMSGNENYILQKEFDEINLKLQNLPEINETDLVGSFDEISGNYSLLQFFYFHSLKHIRRLRSSQYKDLIEIVYNDDKRESVIEFNKWLRNDSNFELLVKVFPILITTNLSSRRLGHKFKFDLLLIDEAGQCDIAQSLLAISKCRNLVLIGDTNQLRPIIGIDESWNNRLMAEYNIDGNYNYFQNSILSVYTYIDNVSNNIMLKYHYRCGKRIINYSNQRFYQNQLNLDKLKSDGEVNLLSVKSSSIYRKNGSVDEALQVIDFIERNELDDVFVLTPFRDQKAILEELISKSYVLSQSGRSVKCGTVHQVQGQENRTIVLSAGITNKTRAKTYDWIKNNSELLNVAVTRAKERLVVAVDEGAIDTLSRKDDDLYALVQYIKSNGENIVAASTTTKFTIGFSNDSKFENEFYKTMSHYCSISGARFQRNVKVISVFPSEINNAAVNRREFDGVLFEGQSPKIIFEINGKEHYKNRKVIDSDKLKMNLAIEKGIPIIFVPNNYVKHYEFISNLIGKINGGSYQHQLFE